MVICFYVNVDDELYDVFKEKIKIKTKFQSNRLTGADKCDGPDLSWIHEKESEERDRNNGETKLGIKN